MEVIIAVGRVVRIKCNMQFASHSLNVMQNFIVVTSMVLHYHAFLTYLLTHFSLQNPLRMDTSKTKKDNEVLSLRFSNMTVTKT